MSFNRHDLWKRCSGRLKLKPESIVREWSEMWTIKNPVFSSFLLQMFVCCFLKKKFLLIHVFLVCFVIGCTIALFECIKPYKTLSRAWTGEVATFLALPPRCAYLVVGRFGLSVWVKTSTMMVTYTFTFMEFERRFYPERLFMKTLWYRFTRTQAMDTIHQRALFAANTIYMYI